MAVYKKDTITESFPACDYVKREEQHDCVNLTAGELLTHNDHHYTIGSAVSSALENGNDPIAAYNRCVANGQEAHFIFAHGSALTSHKQERKTYIKVEFGMMIRFEGEFFTIERAPNDNLKLVMITS